MKAIYEKFNSLVESEVRNEIQNKLIFMQNHGFKCEAACMLEVNEYVTVDLYIGIGSELMSCTKIESVQDVYSVYWNAKYNMLTEQQSLCNEYNFEIEAACIALKAKYHQKVCKILRNVIEEYQNQNKQ